MGQKSWYDVLGVPADASLGEIRRQYLARVREFPPETHGDEFQEVREAYEVLSDPERRKAYDANPGDRIEDEANVRKIDELITKRQWRKLLSLAKTLDEPDRSTLQALAYLFQGRWDSHVRARERVLEALTENPGMLASTLKQLHNLYLHHADADRAEEARELYDRFRSNRTLWRMLWPDYAHILRHLEREREIVDLVEPILPQATDAFRRDDGRLLVEWTSYIFSAGWTDLARRYRARTARYWRHADPDAIAEMKNAVMGFIDDWEAEEELEVAREMAELVMLVDRQDMEVRNRLVELDEEMQVQKEIDRMIRQDKQMNPLVSTRAAWLFGLRMGWEDVDGFESLAHVEPETLYEKEWFAEGVARLKKSYPATYRMFRDDWQAYLATVTSGMNREQRRRLMR